MFIVKSTRLCGQRKARHCRAFLSIFIRAVVVSSRRYAGPRMRRQVPEVVSCASPRDLDLDLVTDEGSFLTKQIAMHAAPERLAWTVVEAYRHLSPAEPYYPEPAPFEASASGQRPAKAEPSIIHQSSLAPDLCLEEKRQCQKSNCTILLR
jgi:hypothetical protein